MYSEEMLVNLAKRENNLKRTFLIVDPLQGKHVPVSPKVSLRMFSALADILKDNYKNKKLIIIGFAETATAICSKVAIDLGCMFIQTTREIVDDEEYLYFSEEHSHATEQKLVKSNIAKYIKTADRIIFIDDEISTGKTILNIISAIKKEYDVADKFSVASLLNGMGTENLKLYNEMGINLHYLVKTNQDEYSKNAIQIEPVNDSQSYLESSVEDSEDFFIDSASNFTNPRKIIESKVYAAACDDLWVQFSSLYKIKQDENVLVLGTEEFMYPAMYIGSKIEENGNSVKFHATTRSPIIVSYDNNYPLHQRVQLRSLYDKDRVTYIYNLGFYDQIFIITDSKLNSREGMNSLVNAVKSKCNNIHILRWGK